MQLDALVRSFSTALRLLTRLPIPGEDHPDNRLVLAFFPAVGAVLGLILWGVAAFLLFAVNSLAAAFICAILLPPFFWWISEGRNLKGMIWVIGNWASHDGDETEDSSYRPYWILLGVQTALLCRVFAIGALVYTGNALWLVIGPVLAMAAHAELLTHNAQVVPQRAPWPLHWLLATGLVLVVSACLPRGIFAGILALVVAWVLTGFLERLAEAQCGKCEDHAHGAIREMVEIVVLLIGILYFLAHV